MTFQAKIISTGSYLPKKILSNHDLEEMVNTSDEWITTRTGMKERRIAAHGETSSDMGHEAAKRALEKAHMDPKEIDLILFATLTPDYLFPSSACLIQEKIGAVAAAFDIQAACSGFLYALSMAKAYVESKMYQTILIIAAEKLSSIVNYKDRSTCVLFGDGAASCIVTSAEKGYPIKNVTLGADGEQAELLILPAGGSKRPASQATVCEGLHYLQMEGKETYKHAVRRMEEAVRICLKQTGITEDEIGYLIPHQANIRIIESLAKRFALPKEKIFLTIHKYGNTSASSVGIALDELLKERKVEKDEHIILSAFGAGLTWGAASLACEK